jgi:hypothetical protein
MHNQDEMGAGMGEDVARASFLRFETPARRAKVLAIEALHHTTATLREWRTEGLIVDMQRAQMAKPKAKLKSSSVVSCTCCFMDFNPAMGGVCRPCLSNPDIAVCGDCVYGMAKSMVNDVVETGTLVTPGGTCMIHHGKAECAAYAVKDIIGILRSCHGGEDACGETVVRKLQSSVQDCGHKLFAIVHACTRVVQCPSCPAKVSVAPTPSAGSQAGALVVACKTCRSRWMCVTCGECGDIGKEEKETGVVVDMDATTRHFGGEDFVVLLHSDHALECRRLPTFYDILATLRASCLASVLPVLPVLPVVPVLPVLPMLSTGSVCKPAASMPSDIAYFWWVYAAVKAQVIRHLERTDPDAGRRHLQLKTPQKVEATHGALVKRADVGFRLQMCFPYLDFVYEAAMKQRCPTCGKDGTKDDMCTHIACCNMWCYGCGAVLQNGVAHVCAFGLHMERDRGEDGSVHASSAEVAVSLFHRAKLVQYVRHWLACAGISRGMVAIRRHEHLGPWWVEYGHLVFDTSPKAKAWLLSAARSMHPDLFREIFGFNSPAIALPPGPEV